MSQYSVVGAEFPSKEFGMFKIVEDLGIDSSTTQRYHFVKIQFLTINMYGFYTTVVTRIQQIRCGDIIDHYQPRICGVACLGAIGLDFGRIEHDPYMKLCYERWRSIIKRCYDKDNASYLNYGAKGVTVCHKWLCFEYFFRDLPNIPNYNLWVNDPVNYHIDKDILQPNIPTNMKIYAPETVIFIPKIENTLEANYRNSTNTSGYIGVSYNNKSGMYAVQVTCNGKKRVRFGMYDDPIAAASEYNRIARKLGYPEEYLNKLDHEMDHMEILKHKSKREIKVNGKYIVAKQII